MFVCTGMVGVLCVCVCVCGVWVGVPVWDVTEPRARALSLSCSRSYTHTYTHACRARPHTHQQMLCDRVFFTNCKRGERVFCVCVCVCVCVHSFFFFGSLEPSEIQVLRFVWNQHSRFVILKIVRARQSVCVNWHRQCVCVNWLYIIHIHTRRDRGVRIL